jgi:hypothetical protein
MIYLFYYKYWITLNDKSGIFIWCIFKLAIVENRSGVNMKQMQFNKELYSRVALIKAAYNFTDVAYLHLDADDKYY